MVCMAPAVRPSTTSFIEKDSEENPAMMIYHYDSDIVIYHHKTQKKQLVLSVNDPEGTRKTVNGHVKYIHFF